MNRFIPIFPLTLVVFPASRYPLHIFEEKYKIMVKECMTKKSGFGIVPTVSKELSTIGCYVVVDTITNKYAAGDFDIVVEGVQRFTIVSKSLHPDGYYFAEVEPYDDNTSKVNEFLVAELNARFKKLVKRINYKLEDSFWNNLQSAELKSFKLAEKSGLSIEQQVELITMQNETERITLLLEHIKKVEKYLDEKASVMKLILNDGYIN